MGNLRFRWSKISHEVVGLTLEHVKIKGDDAWRRYGRCGPGSFDT